MSEANRTPLPTHDRLPLGPDTERMARPAAPFAARPMVVVYSGHSSRPPPLAADEQPISSRALAALDRAEPFPLASDLVLVDAPPVIAPSRAGHLVAQSPEPKPALEPVTASNSPKSSSSLTPTLRTIRPVSNVAFSQSPKQQRAPRPGRAKWGGVWVGAGLVVGTLFAIIGLAPAERSANPAISLQVEAASKQAAAPNPAAALELALSAPLPSTAACPEPPAAAEQAGTIPTKEKVVLRVFPESARVSLRGTVLYGPPYALQVPPGGRIALEISQTGFVTRRVVLDGRARDVVVGLTRNDDALPPATENAEAPSEEPTGPDGPVPVLSGL